ncbi:hypothetical protein EVAR_23440_1 [Eumeta japonica]|uniref:Uncharacterized protein n=1 Tax=Eumeta variegata TaxID=151549 RepID=A0A4C1UKJ6_EUMVA|nr:hypothetical protein EVAR_23440_1 [Eumeta japonica]
MKQLALISRYACLCDQSAESPRAANTLRLSVVIASVTTVISGPRPSIPQSKIKRFWEAIGCISGRVNKYLRSVTTVVNGPRPSIPQSKIKRFWKAIGCISGRVNKYLRSVTTVVSGPDPQSLSLK